MCAGCLNGIPFDIPTKQTDELESVTSLGSYANPALRALITSFKYESATCLEPGFRGLLERYRTLKHPMWQKGTVIVPVPSSEHRIIERGFDHVARLADVVRDILLPDSTVANVFERSRQTISNADLENEDARRGNVLGAFQIVGPVPERILLVDDVVTSGATAAECARLVRRHGAKEVHLFTWARGG